jgi:HK97 family phage portal protein
MNAIEAAMNRASGMVNSARASLHAKAAAANVSVADIVGGGVPGVNNAVNFSKASEQYRANKGWVYACVRLVASRVAGQAIRVARTSPGVTKSASDAMAPLESHPLLNLLDDPNELMVAWGLMFSTVASLELSGRSLWWVTQDEGRQSIVPIPTTWVEEVDAKRTAWKIRPVNSAESFPVPGEQIVHFFYPDPSNPLGALSPLQQIAAAVDADDAIATSQVAAFRRGIHPSHAIIVGKTATSGGESVRPKLTQTQRNQLLGAIKQAYQGVLHYGDPIIYDGIIEKIERISNSPEEMDFLNSGKVTKARILQGYGVSPILLGETEGANRASATVADEIFVANKVNPLLTLLSQTMQAWFAPMFGDGLKVWIEPAVPRDDELTQKKWEQAATRGACTINEFRRNVLGLADIEGGDVLMSPSAAGPSTMADTGAKSIDPMSLLFASDPYHYPSRNGQANRLVAPFTR